MKRLLLLSIFLSFHLLFSFAQSTDTYTSTPQSHRTFDEKSWEEARANIDYSEELEGAEKEAEEEELEEMELEDIEQENESWNVEMLPKLAIILLIIVTAAVVGFILYYQWKNAQPRNEKIDRSGTLTLEEIENNLDKKDPSRALERALQLEDYRLALRLYYLKVIRQLSLSGAIVWKREKTNGSYLRELNNNALRPSFAELTSIFERIWYGNKDLSASDFQHIQPQFDQLLEAIKNDE